MNLDKGEKTPRLALDPEDENNKKMLAAVSEGFFTSAFKTRLAPSFKGQDGIKYLEKSKDEGKVFVVANSRMITNSYDSLMNPAGTDFMYRPKPGPNELLYDRELAAMRIQHLFGNQDFFMNLVDYMMGDNSVLDIRSRQIEIHAIDKSKVIEDATFYKIINVGLTILIILILAVTLFLIRKRKYA
jgi:ABC-2 type transport system permease protein